MIKTLAIVIMAIIMLRPIGEEGDWQTVEETEGTTEVVVNNDESAMAIVPNLWDRPEYSGYCVPVDGVGSLVLIWPVESHEVYRDRGFRPGAHTAIDINAPVGTQVRAANTGIVTWAGGAGRGFGNIVVLASAGNWSTLYAHLQDVSVLCNQRVVSGQPIGTVGRTGSTTFDHLHFEVRNGITAFNPLRWLGSPNWIDPPARSGDGVIDDLEDRRLP